VTKHADTHYDLCTSYHRIEEADIFLCSNTWKTERNRIDIIRRLASKSAGMNVEKSSFLGSAARFTSTTKRC